MERRIGKVTLTEEIALLQNLAQTLKVAVEKAKLIADVTGSETATDNLRWAVIPMLRVQQERVELELYRAQEAQQEAADDQVEDEIARTRGEQEIVSLQEDLGR